MFIATSSSARVSPPDGTPPALLRAYRMTSYAVDGVVVRPGRRSAGFDRLLRRSRCRTATFIAADNPFSRRMPPGWNRRMQHRLRCAARRHAVLAATGSWRGWREAHLLLFGDPRPALRLARIFRQRAVVVVRLNQPAAVVLIV
jgi:Protein of unknown function (DUF3293)